MLLACLVLLAGAAPHPDSLSSSLVVVEGRFAHVRLRCQHLSLEEVIEGLDGDSDGQVTELELQAQLPELQSYIANHYRLFVGSDRDLTGGQALDLQSFAVKGMAPGTFDELGYKSGAAEFALTLAAPTTIEDLMIEVTLFQDTSPDHVDLATLQWAGGGTSSFGITREHPRVRSDPEGRGVFVAFMTLGFRHILSGWDHLAFVMVLVLGARSLRSLLGLVTAFTAAHSVTLALSAMKLVDLAEYSNLIELVIALSIAYMAVDNLLREPTSRSRWLEAFAFGLIHGLGFAGFLGRSLVGEETRGWALVSFNVGVEFGQLLVVGVALVVLLPLKWRHKSQEGKSALAPAWLRISGSVAIAGLGLYWFAQRL